MIYIIIFAALCLNLLHCSGAAACQRFSAQIWLSFFVFFVGLRRWVGCDFPGYLLNWDVMKMAVEFREGFAEPGFVWLVRTLQVLDLEYWSLNLIAGCIYLYGAKKLADRQPRPLAFIALSFPVLIIHLAMSGIRQAMAVGFLMLAFNAACDRRRLSFIMLVAAAASFHASAIIFLPLVLAIGRSPPMLAFAGIYAVAMVGLVWLTPATFETYHARYLGEQTAAVATGGPVRAFMVTIAGVIFFLMLRSAWKERFSRDFDLVRLLAFATLPLLPISVVSSIVADRLAFYLMPTQLIIFARMPLLLARAGHSRNWDLIPYLLLGGFLIVWVTFSPLAMACYMPYDNYLLGDLVTKHEFQIE
jgi:hypothetical protein